jgi:uncharacterized protein YndB with AHSA1/START domain
MTDELESADGTGLRIERVLPASARDVFSAWTDPSVMARWLSPSGRAEVEVDLRVGGSFRVAMVGDGMQIDHHGEYLVVESPRKLVFTWCSRYTGPGPSVVTVVLTPRGDDTHLLLIHEQLPTEHRESHESGWGSILDNLVSLIPELIPNEYYSASPRLQQGDGA